MQFAFHFACSHCSVRFVTALFKTLIRGFCFCLLETKTDNIVDCIGVASMRQEEQAIQLSSPLAIASLFLPLNPA